MLTQQQLVFLIQALTAKSPQGASTLVVSIENARLAADTFEELKAQLEACNRSDNPDITDYSKPLA